MKIEPIPRDIPEALRTAATTQKLVPFIGAGVSVLAGCPNWNQFADKTLKFLFENEILNYAHLDQMKGLNARVKLSLAVSLAKQYKVHIDFATILNSSKNQNKNGEKAYNSIAQIGEIFLTTNYDDLLDKTPLRPAQGDAAMPAKNSPNITREKFFKEEDLTVVNMNTSEAVFHIHGSVRDTESMLLTTVDYLNRYANRFDENPYTTFLETIFRSKNILFIGYGLGELEILEYIIQKGVKSVPYTRQEPKHYVIQGFYSHQEILANSMEEYYLQFGIGLIPYSLDDLEWGQLADVLEYYASEIPTGPKLILPERQEMENLLS